MEQTVTTIARKLNFSGFGRNFSSFSQTSVLQMVIVHNVTNEGNISHIYYDMILLVGRILLMPSSFEERSLIRRTLFILRRTVI